MSTLLSAAIVGCGRPRRESGSTGFGIAHPHARGYEAHPDTTIVAVADIKRENGEAFAREHDVPNVYDSHEEMLEKESIDIVIPIDEGDQYWIWSPFGSAAAGAIASLD